MSTRKSIGAFTSIIISVGIALAATSPGVAVAASPPQSVIHHGASSADDTDACGGFGNGQAWPLLDSAGSARWDIGWVNGFDRMSSDGQAQHQVCTNVQSGDTFRGQLKWMASKIGTYKWGDEGGPIRWVKGEGGMEKFKQGGLIVQPGFARSVAIYGSVDNPDTGQTYNVIVYTGIHN